MVALPTLSSHGANADRRKRVVTYGKTSRNASSSTKTFFETQDSTPPRSNKLKRVPSSVTKKPHSRPKDDFDLTSSSADENPPSRAIKPPKKSIATTAKANAKPTRADDDSVSPYKRKRTSSQPMAVKATIKASDPPAQPGTVQDEPSASQPRRSQRQAIIHTRPATIPNTQSHHEPKHSPRPKTLATIISCPNSPSLESPGSPHNSPPSVSTTPKQKKLWHELLQSDPPDMACEEQPPSDMSPQRPLPRINLRRATSDTSYVSAVRRGRLVDRLKHNAKPESSESSEAESELATDRETEHTSPPANYQTSFSQPAPQKAQSQPQMPLKHASLSQGGSSHRVTYGPTRSYLQESLEDMIFGDTPIAQFERPSAPMRRTNVSSKKVAKPRERQKDDSDDASGPSQGIKSIHELRAAGVKNGFLDDVVRLMDDIKDPKPTLKSRRRSALMELALKLADKGFASRFIEHGFHHDLVTQFGFAGTDIISNITLCVVLTRLCHEEITERCTAPLFNAGALDFLTSCLEDTTSVTQVVRNRRYNMSKIAQSDFVDFCESIRVSDFWVLDVPECLSLRLVALKGSELLILAHRRAGSRDALLSSELATTLVGMISSANTTADNVTQLTTHMALSVLEAASTLDMLDHATNVWTVGLVSRTASALSSMLQMPKPSQALALRLCLSMTNGHSRNCDALADASTLRMFIGYIIGGFNDLYQRQEEGRNTALDCDLLILALALVLNIMEHSNSAREKASLEEEHGATVLVDSFLQGREKSSEAQSEEEMQINVAYGYLAILLANMCQNSTMRAQICARLPGQKLSVLEEAAYGFLRLHQEVDSQMLAGNEGGEMAANFTQRLSAMVGHLQDSGK